MPLPLPSLVPNPGRVGRALEKHGEGRARAQRGGERARGGLDTAASAGVAANGCELELPPVLQKKAARLPRAIARTLTPHEGSGSIQTTFETYKNRSFLGNALGDKGESEMTAAFWLSGGTLPGTASPGPFQEPGVSTLSPRVGD
ncbi:uncharacterized protein LOC144287859 [Canis aureus]